MENERHSGHMIHSESVYDKETFELATRATAHCILGCGIGEGVKIMFTIKPITYYKRVN